MSGTAIIILGCALSIGIAAVGGCIGLAILGGKYVESSARQPEVMDKLMTKAILFLGVIEGSFLIAAGMIFALAMMSK